MMATGSKFLPKIAAKPLQIDRVTTVYIDRNIIILIALCNGVIIDLYDVRFSHNTYVTDDRQMNDTSYSGSNARPNRSK